MNFPTIDLEQEHVERFLDACMRGRVPALLFTGPDGVGKTHTAVDFARRLCCPRDPVCRLDGDLCESCYTALALGHVGIRMIYATPTQGSGEKEDDDELDIGKILAEKRQDFFGTYHFSKKASLRIARARAMIKRANSKPFGTGYNVFIVVDAHLMREEAQNALLKLVEEPPERCAIIFITPNPDAILYTIRSRCQRVRFSPLKPAVIEKLLTDYYGVAKDTARKAASLAQGSVLRAREIASNHDDEDRQSAYDILQRVKDAPESWVIGQALSVTRGGNRDGVARFLHEMATAFRDAMVEDPDIFINQDQKKLLQAQAKKWDRTELPAIVDRILETRDGILRRNLTMDAALVQLFLDIKHARC